MRYLILSVLNESTGFKMRIQAAFCIAAFLKIAVSLNISCLIIYPYELCILVVNVMSARY